MKNQHHSSQGSREQGFEFSYKLALDQLSKTSDLAEQCRKSGARYVGPNEIVVDYLNQPYHITIPDAEVLLENSKAEVPLKDKILILHYFTSSKGTPLTGTLISYKQLPGGVSYFPAFTQRAINPFVRHFGRKPELLIELSAKLSGHKANHGDVSVTIDAFNHVPITFALWRGDDEFPPNGGILFDANISDYLSTEDITVLCETIVWKLVKNIPTS